MPSSDHLSTMFHGTHPALEGKIKTEGLIAKPLNQEGILGEGVKSAVFLTPDAEEAQEYGDKVFSVNTEGLNLVKVDGPYGYHYASPSSIPASRIS
jgi:hypothetical protein